MVKKHFIVSGSILASPEQVSVGFVIHYPDGKVEQKTFAQKVIKVGRLPTSHLFLDDDKVSRMHAVIEVTSRDEIYVIDVGSASGTFVNGKQVNKSQLRSGDELAFGNIKINVLLGETAEALAYNENDDQTVVEMTNPGAKEEVDRAVARATQVSPQQVTPQRPAAEPTVQQSAAPPPLAAPRAPKISESRFAAATSASQPDPFENRGAAAFSTSSPSGAPSAFLPDTNSNLNPFAVSAGASLFQEEGEGYRMIASGGPVSPDEVETHQSAVEVMIMWGENSVLHVSHLAPPRSFYVGETEKTKEHSGADYLIGAETLGTELMPVIIESGGVVNVVIPNGADASLTLADRTLGLNQLAAENKLSPCPQLAGAQQLTLPAGSSVRVAYKGFVFLVKPVHAGRPVGIGSLTTMSMREQMWTIVSAALHLAFLIMVYFLPPRPSALSLDLLNMDPRMIDYTIDPEELEEEKINATGQGDEGGTGERHKDEEGQMGKEDSAKTKNKYAIKGPKDNPDPHMAREQAKEQASNAGVIGVLRQMAGAFNTPTSPYGRDSALGTDDVNALGALMGVEAGDNYGHGGLGLRGTGRGGGGTGMGTLGLGRLGTLGHGAGGGSGSGYGSGAGGLGGRKGGGAPSIRPATPSVMGSLSKEVIRRVVQRHLNEVRFCYEQELQKRPDLDGRVAIKFIIAPNGSVQSATPDSSTIGSNEVEQCIAKSVRMWTFPSPEGGGIVVVTYPFVLTAGGGE